MEFNWPEIDLAVETGQVGGMKRRRQCRGADVDTTLVLLEF